MTRTGLAFALRPRALLWRLLLAAIAIVPMVLVLVWLRGDLMAGRTAEVRSRLALQAALVSRDIGGIVQAAFQQGRLIAQLPEIAAVGPGCSARLHELLHGLPAYAALSVIDAPGRPPCAATAAAEAGRMAVPPGLGGATVGRGAVGRFARASGASPAMLPLAVRYRAAGDMEPALMLGLSLDWLDRQLPTRGEGGSRTVLTVVDADGTIVARVPDGSAFLGLQQPAALRRVVADGRAVMAAGFGGGERFAVSVPVAGTGLVVTASEAPPGLFDGGLGGSAARLGGPVGVLLLLATAANVWLLLRFNARLDRRPMAALARMTELLARQRAELQDLNATLEARVAARTRDLVASRNQLQLQGIERERAAAELRDAHKLQAVGQLAGGIAHDFNNLLGAVASALAVLRRRLGERIGAPGQPDLATPLATAEAETARGARLTARLLAFARRQRLLPAPTDLNRLVGELPGLVGGALGSEIRIRTLLEPALWPALVDPGQVEAALLNLVLNARDAMPAGGTLTLSTANLRLPDDLPTGPDLAPGDYVAVRVADTGAGIAPDVLARVFEPFFTTKPAGSASGLGLPQVHGVALQSGGDVRIDTRSPGGGSGHGTTVTLLLPRAEGAAPACSTRHDARRRSLRILVADDDEAVRRMTGELLAECGHRPVLAADATQALAILEKDLAETGGSFDVLLSDYMMPGTNGAALILMAQALQPHMHALLVTGHAELGADDPLRPQDILRKPFTIAELEARLDAICGEAAPQAVPGARQPAA